MNFEYLKVVAKALNKERIKRQSSLFDEEEGAEDKRYAHYYQLLRKDDLNIEDEVAKLMGFNSADDPKYQAFKSIYSEKQLNSVGYIDLDLGKRSAYTIAKINCGKYLNFVSIFLLNGNIEAARLTALRVLDIALERQFTQEILLACNHLLYISCRAGDLKKYNYYNKIYTEQTKILEVEKKATHLLYMAFMDQGQQTIPKAGTWKKTLASAKIVDILYAKYKTYELGRIACRLGGQAHYINQNYLKAAEYFHKMEKMHARAIKQDQKYILGEACTQQMACYMHTRDYEKAGEEGAKCVQYYRPGTANWFVFMHQYALLAMHEGRYDVARQRMEEATGHTFYKEMDDVQTERWKIFKGYLGWVEYIKNENRDQYWQFDMKELKKSIKHYEHDKAGINFSLRLLELLHALTQPAGFNKLTELMSGMERYQDRHLGNDVVKRANTLMDMIILMERKSYDLALIKEKTDAQYTELTESSKRHEGSMDGMEVVPYKVLWKMVEEYVEILNKKLR